MPLALAATALIAAAPRDAATNVSTRSKEFESVVACRTIDEPVQRLACFDRSVEALQAAADKRDIVVVDRADVQKARRSLFGFNLPSLKIFGGDDSRTTKGERALVEEEEQEISSTVTSAQLDRDGFWTVVLADGAVWQQTDGVVALRPRAGTVVAIRRAALGSYFMRIGKQAGVKARRER